MIFTDTNGKEWKLKIDAFFLEEMRDEAGVDLSDPDSTDEATRKLAFDEICLVRTLWVLCREQAGEDIDRRAFSRRLVGDAVLTGAREALEKAVLDFFPSWKREALRSQLKAFEAIRSETEEQARLIETESSSASSSQESVESVPAV